MNIALECEVAAAGLLVVVFDLISALILLLMILITGPSAAALSPFSVSSFNRSQFICMFITNMLVAANLFCWA
jgi:hypothetical protein